MTHVVAYTYLADTYLPEEALQDWNASRLAVNHQHPCALPMHGFDEHGLPYNLQDADDNLIHPVFDTDEGAV